MRISRAELKNRVGEVHNLMSRCRLCPRQCGVDRTKRVGFCEAGLPAKIYSYRQHLGEEPPISGTRGSGVIFFSHCTMKCVYCQNFKFSQYSIGYNTNPDQLCKIMLSLKKKRCHNINLVTPSHYLPTILEALLLSKKGLGIPIVYNTSGYESKEVLNLLDGITDIYLTDMRYSDNKLSQAYSAVDDYVEVNRAAVSLMDKQVGGLIFNKDGMAKRGLIIRHLVLPNFLSNTEGVLKYIATHISKKTYISMMSQYLPLHKAKEFSPISRPITQKEYKAACSLLNKYDLHYGWTQDF